MPKPGERGLIQLLLLLLMIAGIVLGLFLLKDTKIFRPKASVSGPISPQTSFILEGFNSVGVGNEFSVKVYTRSDIDLANLFAAKLRFSPQLLEVVRIDKSNTFVTNWVEEYFDNLSGEISLVGGIPTPGQKSAVGQPNLLLAEIIFKGKAFGDATVSFTDGAAIYRDSDNANILGPKSDLAIKVVEFQDRIVGPLRVVYDLQAGWNSIGVPVQTNLTPEQLLQATADQCIEILGVNPDNALWDYVTEIVGGKGYLIKCSSPTTLTLTGGSPVTTMPNLSVSNANYVSLPIGKSMTAKEFLEAVSSSTLNCTEVNRYVAGKWEAYNKGLPSNSLQMNDKEGYIVKCVAATSACPTAPTCPAGSTLIHGDPIDDRSCPVWFCSGGSTPTPGTGDANGDGKINLVDLSILLSDFNKTSGFRPGIDLKGDGKVNSFDFSLMRNLLIEKKVIRG